MDKKEISAIIIVVVAIVAVIGLFFLSVQYEKKHPCIETKDVCQNVITSTSILIAGKTPMPTTQTTYTDVDCSKSHDRVIQRCTKRK